MESSKNQEQTTTKINYFARSDVKTKILPAYLVVLVFSLYGFGICWMSVCTLIVVIAQFILLGLAYFDGKDALVSELNLHKEEAAKSQRIACLSIIGLILLDGFPFYCEWGWLGDNSIFRTYYEGGIFNTIYLSLHGLFLLMMLVGAYTNVDGIDSSHQNYLKALRQKKQEEEENLERERKEKEKQLDREKKEREKQLEEIRIKEELLKPLGEDIIKLQYYTRAYHYFSSENESCKAELYFSKDYSKFCCGDKIYLGKQILDYQVVENTITNDMGSRSYTSVNTGNMLKRAAIGGLLTGGTGAVIGAATASRTTSADDVVLSRNEHYIEITLDDANCPLLNLYFRENKQLLKSVERILFIIIKRNNECVSANQTGSVADELLKLKQLKDAGVLTDEEIEVQKKKLLS